MAKNKPVWGIDLGQCVLKAICLRAAGDKVEAVDYAYIEHSRILSQPGVERAEIIAESMKKFMEKHDLSQHAIVVGVPGQHTLARFTKLPPVDKKKIPEIVKYEAQQQIPFDMEEVIWDYQTFENPEAMETEVGIFAMRRELMREHLKYLSDLRLEPAIVQSAPLALYNALRYDGLIGSEPVAILDIGAQNTDLLAVDGNSLWTRNIPIGGNAFTDVLLKTFKLSFNKAENLKRSAGSSKYARQVFQAMRPVFADLVAEIQRSIGFYTSSRRGLKLNKLIAMGNAFRLPGMPKFIQQNLGMEVVRPTTFSRLSASGAPNAPQLMDQLLSFGVAYGLALQGLDLAPITSSLLPPEIAKQVVWQKKTPWFYGAAACLALAACLVWGRNLSDERAVAAGAGDGEGPPPPATVEQAIRVLESGPPTNLAPKVYADHVLKAQEILNSEKNKIEAQIKEKDGEMAKLAELNGHKPVWPQILHLVHAALPKPDAEVLRATTEGPQAFKSLILSDPVKYARDKRQQVFIEQFKTEYTKDVDATMKAKRESGTLGGGMTGGGMIGGGPMMTPGSFGSGTPAASPSAARPGFVVTMVCQTPYAGGDLKGVLSFIQKVLMENLKSEGQKGKGLYFDSIGYLGSPVALRDARTQTGTGTAFGGAVRSAGAVEDMKDPVTEELMSRDWQFQVLFAVVLGDKPPAGAAPGAAPPSIPPADG